MARLVAAFGSSHSPALNSPAEDIPGHARRDEQYQKHLDREGRLVSYQELLHSAPAGVEDEISTQRIERRVAACERHIDRLARAIAEARLDALLIVGDDQKEQYLDDNLPAFLVYGGETILNGVMDLPPGAPDYWKRARSQYFEPDVPRDYPVAADLALHITKELVEREFDIAYGASLPRPRGEGHAFGFVHRRLLAGHIVPVVPIVVNTYYAPNQPRPARCFRLGQALRSSIDSFPGNERVGILASGGLSHFTVDEALDRAVLKACGEGDGAALGAIPIGKLNSGSSEIRNWIVAAGAAEELRTEWQAYEPLYRTPAGTGCGMAFAVWGTDPQGSVPPFQG
ncbi:MAG TPA: protocatechuate 3,4-dioxygenase [Burkholderiales bacterium]|nr:protocatechuate 3,4-dioxygenase [Burkholderiales bacterium]